MDNLMGSEPFSMSYRKGEITPRIIDRDFPHQVELRADLTTGKNYDVALEFCRDLSLAPRGLSRRKNNTDYNVWCFADPAHADAFQARFGGERQTVRPRKAAL
jgi:hypothetical protein